MGVRVNQPGQQRRFREIQLLGELGNRHRLGGTDRRDASLLIEQHGPIGISSVCAFFQPRFFNVRMASSRLATR